MKKRIFLVAIGVIATVMLVLMLSVILFYARINYVLTWKAMADYEICSEEFIVVKDYVLEQYPNAVNKGLEVTTGPALYDYERGAYLDCPQEVVEALDKIDEYAFTDKDGKFETIRINGTRVSFCIANGNYALVYSPDENPSWINVSTEDKSVVVKKIGNGWYHVAEDN